MDYRKYVMNNRKIVFLIFQSFLILSLVQSAQADDYGVVISSTSGGSVTTPGEGSWYYPPSEWFDVVATSEAIHYFSHWEGIGVDIEDTSDPTTRVKLNSNDAALLAVFKRKYGVVISSTSGGSVTTPGEGSRFYPLNEWFDVVATSEAIHYFSHWEGIGVVIDDTTDPTTRVRVTSTTDSAALVAVFERKYGVVISSTSGGSVTTPGEGSKFYPLNEWFNVVATASDNSHFFSHWEGVGVDIENTADPTTRVRVTSTTDSGALTAVFKEYGVVISSTSGGSVTTPGEGSKFYPYNEWFDVVATSENIHYFSHWEGVGVTIENTTDPSTRVRISSATDSAALLAVFERKYGVAISSDSGGSVTTPGEGSKFYPLNEWFDVVATSDNLYRFSHWEGIGVDIDDTSDPTTVVRVTSTTDSAALLAVFERERYGVVISSTSGGSVTTPGEGSKFYPLNEWFDVDVAIENIHYFSHWEGIGVDIDDTGDPTTLVRVTSTTDSAALLAVFERKYGVVISSTSGGSVTTPGEGSIFYPQNEWFDVVATSEDIHHFSHWEGIGVDIDDASDPTTLVRVTSTTDSAALLAVFERKYGVVISSTSGGSVTTPGEGSMFYPHNEWFDVIATSDNGQYFSHWEGIGVDIDDTANLMTRVRVTSTSDSAALIAVFKEYGVVISSTSGGSVTTPGEGSMFYSLNEWFDVVATSEDIHSFSHWEGVGVTIENTSDSATRVMLNTNDAALLAVFERRYGVVISSTIGGNVTAPGEGSRFYQHNEWFDVVATGDSYFYFTHWEGVGVDIDDTTNPMTRVRVTSTTDGAALLAAFRTDNPVVANEGATFQRIQDAIDAFDPGQHDAILVADGFYTGPGNYNIDPKGKTIELKSINGPGACIIDCQDQGRAFYLHSGEDERTIINGFTIIGGSEEPGSVLYCQGASPTLGNCVMMENAPSVVWISDILHITGTLDVTDGILEGDSTILLSENGYLRLSNCIIRCDIQGDGNIEIPAGQDLTLAGGVNCTIEGEIECSGYLLIEDQAILAQSLLLLSDGGTLNLLDDASMQDNYILLNAESFMDINIETTESNLPGNRLHVIVDQDSQLEVRGEAYCVDQDDALCLPGSHPLSSVPDFSATTMTLDTLEILPGMTASLVDNQVDQTTYPFDVLYVNNLILGENAELALGSERLYYQSVGGDAKQISDQKPCNDENNWCNGLDTFQDGLVDMEELDPDLPLFPSYVVGSFDEPLDYEITLVSLEIRDGILMTGLQGVFGFVVSEEDLPFDPLENLTAELFIYKTRESVDKFPLGGDYWVPGLSLSEVHDYGVNAGVISTHYLRFTMEPLLLSEGTYNTALVVRKDGKPCGWVGTERPDLVVLDTVPLPVPDTFTIQDRGVKRAFVHFIGESDHLFTDPYYEEPPSDDRIKEVVEGTIDFTDSINSEVIEDVPLVEDNEAEDEVVVSFKAFDIDSTDSGALSTQVLDEMPITTMANKRNKGEIQFKVHLENQITKEVRKKTAKRNRITFKKLPPGRYNAKYKVQLVRNNKAVSGTQYSTAREFTVKR